MTDYAPDFTYRYRVSYRAGGFAHNFNVRGPTGLAEPVDDFAFNMATAVHDYFAALAAILWTDFEFLSAAYAAAGSNIFIPTTRVPAAITPTGFDPADYSARMRATACTHAGRGVPSGAARLYWFGSSVVDSLDTDEAGDGAISVANVAGLDTATAVANANFFSSAGFAALWYPRLTTKVNDRLLRVIRRTVSV